MYLWSIEFGLMGNPSAFWVYGAALLSSPTEFRAVCEAPSRVRPYSLEVIDHDIADEAIETLATLIGGTLT